MIARIALAALLVCSAAWAAKAPTKPAASGSGGKPAKENSAIPALSQAMSCALPDQGPLPATWHGVAVPSVLRGSLVKLGVIDQPAARAQNFRARSRNRGATRSPRCWPSR